MYGLCSSKDKESATFDYGIGVLIDKDTDTSNLESLCAEGFTIWKTEPTDYVVFKCYGEDGNSISEMWSRFFKEFLPQSSYEHTDDTDYEIYFEHGEKGLFCELWIPIVEKGKR